MSQPEFKYIWYWRKRLGEYKGRPCRLLAVGKLNSVLIEFKDGRKFVTDRRGLRKADKENETQ